MLSMVAGCVGGVRHQQSVNQRCIVEYVVAIVASPRPIHRYLVVMFVPASSSEVLQGNAENEVVKLPKGGLAVVYPLTTTKVARG